MVKRLVVLSLILSGFAMAQAPPRPNIVVMLSDDMGWEQVGFNGGKEVPTPHIDSIARDGVKMTQFYVQPVCTPTRACLMTGRYAWKNGGEIRPTATSKHGMLRDERTLPEALREAGYATWMTGKWHLGEWQSIHLPLARGFEHHYGHYGALIDSFTHTRAGVLDWHRNGEPVVEEGYSPFLVADEAARLIASHDDSKPFFLYVPFNAVHGPHQAPDEYLRKYAHLGKNAAQRAQMECLDVAVGRILGAIARKGIAEKTLVIFTNDNGGTPNTSNGPYKGFKSAYHEGGVRVPFAARWPGVIPKGSSSDEMLHIVDLFPTFCRLAGANPDRGLPLDGEDAWETIASGAKSPRQEVAHSLDVLRQGRWKLIEEGAQYYNWGPEPLQLYDIEADPYEKRNLAAENPDVVKQLSVRLKDLEKDAREGEKVERIPGYPPAVYGEREEARWGKEVRKKLEASNVRDRDATINRPEQ